MRYAWTNVVQTSLRLFPFPRRTGLVKIGNPDRNSPVFLTCNFDLTVERVKRAMQGMDAYLVVANSRGVNVWCAATGGLFTNHDVVSVLKTSGINDLVDHRQVVLPQLAATGIEGKIVYEKTGWKVVWGPVRAASIPDFAQAGLKTTKEMRTVDFPWPERFEMAVAWAFPISLLSLLLYPVWAGAVVWLAALVWALSFLIFMSFPLYERRIHAKGKDVGFILFDFGERGIPLVLWAMFLVVLSAYATATGQLAWPFMLSWGSASAIVLLILGLDLTGSTPVYKSGLHEDRLLGITLNADLCKGAGFCEDVCPKDVFHVDRVRRMASLPRAVQCVQCGACVVQCPFDALYFESPTGDIVTPATVRKFKLNLLGTRKA
jgi:NAD-dependent dihydropyrimidine dehydrogenase PreA subunit